MSNSGTAPSPADTRPASGSHNIGASLGDGTTQHQPSEWTRRTGLITCLVVATIVGVMLIGGLIRAGNRPDRFTESSRQLTKALADIPFTVRLPDPVPANARLVGVIVQAPDKNRGPSIYAMETTYTLVGDTAGEGNRARYFKIWQTNDVYIRKTALDPLGQRLNPTKIGDDTWYRRSGQSEDDRTSGVSFTTRFSDGITMVVSGPDEKLVRQTIDNLRFRS
jgi:hypothetical protein